MIYSAVEVIWSFLADGTGRVDGTVIEGTLRGPRGPKNKSFGHEFREKIATFFPKRGVGVISLSIPVANFPF